MVIRVATSGFGPDCPESDHLSGEVSGLLKIGEMSWVRKFHHFNKFNINSIENHIGFVYNANSKTLTEFLVEKIN